MIISKQKELFLRAKGDY